MAQPLKFAVEKFFDNYTDWRFTLLKNWQTVIGPLHIHMRLERIENDTLIIGVYDVHWMHELYMLTRTIIRTVNQGLGGSHVRHLRFKLVERGQDKSRKKNTSNLSGSASHIRSLTPREQTTLERIKDPQLKELLYAFLLRALGGDGGK
jgi:hypothetical protein